MVNSQLGRQYAVVLADVVGSRSYTDQTALIGALTEALTWSNARASAVQPLEVTVGDEFQGAYESVGEALNAALFTTLWLAGRYDLRFGIGWGEITSFDPDRAPMAQSGSAWWSAREAIDRVKETATKRQWPRTVRTLAAGLDEPLVGILNGFLICRDALLGKMDPKDLRITRGLFSGERQADIARELGISQPSVARRQVENGASAVYQAHCAARGLVP